jgi:tRNA nucleotidyltransferase (CCA-adding enzyme)
MLQNLKALQHVDIDLFIYYPIETEQEKIQTFNEAVKQKKLKHANE